MRIRLIENTNFVSSQSQHAGGIVRALEIDRLAPVRMRRHQYALGRNRLSGADDARRIVRLRALDERLETIRYDFVSGEGFAMPRIDVDNAIFGLLQSRIRLIALKRARRRLPPAPRLAPVGDACDCAALLDVEPERRTVADCHVAGDRGIVEPVEECLGSRQRQIALRQNAKRAAFHVNNCRVKRFSIGRGHGNHRTIGRPDGRQHAETFRNRNMAHSLGS